MQKIFYLPEAHTDFILAVIGEELGVAGVCGLLFLYGMIGYAGLRTAKNAKGAYAKLLAGGLTSLILCQALLNVYAVLGLAPLTGVPLPFVSSGSTSLIVLLCSMGLLLNIAGGGSAHLRALPARPRVTTASGARPPRIVIAAGGTAGHVVPAIAVADALRAEGAEVTFVGGERAEAELVPAAGYPLDRIAVEGISRSNPLKAARALAQGRGRARHRPPDPARRAARRRAGRRRLRRRPGRARRGAAADPARARRGRLAPRPDQPRARARAPAASASRSRSRAATASATASPAGPSRRPSTDRAGARAELGIGPEETVVLVFGGSLGARSINHAAVEALAGAPYRVLHVAGKRDFAELRAPDERYLLRDYLTPFGDGARRRRPRRRPLRRLGVRARPVRPARRCWSRTRTPRPTTRPPTRAGWATPAPPSSCATPS